MALTISAVVLVAGTFATGVALNHQATEQRSQFRETNKEALRLLSLAIVPALADNAHYRVQAILDNVANFPEQYPDIRSVEVVGLNQRVVADIDPRRFNVKLTDADVKQDLARDNPQVRRVADDLFIVMPVKLSLPLGVIRARFSEQRLEASIENQQKYAALLLLATMAMVAFALNFLHRHLVGRRLSALAGTATKLGKGQMDVRAELEGEDEISELGVSFNKMAGALEDYTNHLQKMVDERTEELQEANTRLELLATTDQLTSLYNRRHFDEYSRRAIEVARRNKRPLSIVLIDTDRFKSVNDRFGHPVGDIILRDVAQILKSNARKADMVARIGGEEFAVLMPEATEELAFQGAERMRKALEESPHPDAPELGDEKITASFGLAAMSSAEDKLEDLLSAADAAMYESKSTGRNKVTVAQRPPASESQPTGSNSSSEGAE